METSRSPTTDKQGEPNARLAYQMDSGASFEYWCVGSGSNNGKSWVIKSPDITRQYIIRQLFSSRDWYAYMRMCVVVRDKED
jgi:hypothetical protein